MDREPLFETAHNALLFAFNFSDQQYERPLMNRLADDPDGHVSKGLSGTDGAAQAGMIMSRIMLMPALSHRVLRDAIIRKMFGARVDIVEAAERCGLEERRAYQCQSAIKQWLDGKRVPKKDDPPGVRAVAFQHISRILIDSGIVKTSEEAMAS